MSQTIQRRRRWRTVATAAALSLGSLAIPAAAMADGAIDPNFNGTGYRLGTAAEGTTLDASVSRVAALTQADGKIIVAGQSADDFMTLVRYNLNGSVDSTFGSGGSVRMQFAGTPAGLPGASGADAIVQDASGNLYVAGSGGSQSEFVARFTPSGAYTSSAVCYAPHLIDYTARALSLRPNGTVVIAGFARDRYPANPTPPALPGPNVIFGQRAVLALPVSGNSTTACGTYSEVGGLSRGSSGVTIDGLSADGTITDATRGGLQYDGVVALANNSYVTVATNGWVQRFTAAGALDTTFNAGRVAVLSSAVPVSLHAVTLAGDGSLLAAGEASGQIVLARIAANGATTNVTPYTAGSGGDMGQAIALQGDGKILIGGGATVAGRTALALVRFTAAGVVDDSFANAGQAVLNIGTGNAYIGGISVNGPTVGFAARATTAEGLVSAAGRYYAIGDPPPVPVVPVTPVTPVVTPVTTPGTVPVTTTGGATRTTPTVTVTTKKKVVKKSCIVPKVTGKKLNAARVAIYAKGCKVQVRYAASKKANNTVLAQSRKAGKTFGYRSVVKLTVAKKASAIAKDKKSS